MRLVASFLLLGLLAGCSTIAKESAPKQSAGKQRGDSPALTTDLSPAKGPAQNPVFISADGRYVLTTDDQFAGVYLTDTTTGTSTTITHGWNSGYHPRVSADGKLVLYKGFLQGRDEYMQAAFVHDTTTGTAKSLTGWVKVAGTPSIAADGQIAWASNGSIFVAPGMDGEWRSYDVGHTPNLIEFSPDSKTIAYTDSHEQIALLDLSSGKTTVLTDGQNSYWAPRFTPDGRRLLARTINSKVVAVDLAVKEQKACGEGESPDWVDNDRIAMIDGDGKVKLIAFGAEPKSAAKVGEIGPRWYAHNRGRFASFKDDKVRTAALEGDAVAAKGEFAWEKARDPDPVLTGPWPADLQAASLPGDRGLVDKGPTVEITGVPYLNQKYDITDAHAGHWACNATAAIMALGYWDALKPHPMTVSKYVPHTSNFGYYITEPYECGSTTFDTASPGPDGDPVKGAYGYIVRDDWKDTKSYMRDYFRLHGIASETDWAPSFEKIKAEIDKKQPLVVLHIFMPAGHYCTAIGYDKVRRTIVFNDPYGNKNSRVYPSIDGRRAKYDMPGYNNGYQNLRTVQCFIYSRGPEKK